MPKRTSIGGLLLEAVAGWSFSVRDGAVAGVRGHQPGVMRITTLAANVLPNPLTHESCLQIAAKFAVVPEPMLRAQQTVASATGPFGWGSGRWGKDYVCAWYCTRPLGLIIGVYAFPVSLFDKSEQHCALDECAHMVSSAIFDRTPWGANEPVTHFLMAQLAAERNVLPEGAEREIRD
jgi:hypothetical protein